MIPDIGMERTDRNVPSIGHAVRFDLIFPACDEPCGLFKISNSAVDFPDRDIPVTSVAVEAGIVREFGYADSIKFELEKAFSVCLSDRPGPVLLDIPMNIQRTEIDPDKLVGYSNTDDCNVFSYSSVKNVILKSLLQAERPLIVAGAGISNSGSQAAFQQLMDRLKIPAVTSMVGIDCVAHDSPYHLGFIGSYGHRHACYGDGRPQV